jgi:hypothetical protein
MPRKTQKNKKTQKRGGTKESGRSDESARKSTHKKTKSLHSSVRIPALAKIAQHKKEMDNSIRIKTLAYMAKQAQHNEQMKQNIKRKTLAYLAKMKQNKLDSSITVVVHDPDKQWETHIPYSSSNKRFMQILENPVNIERFLKKENTYLKDYDITMDPEDQNKFHATPHDTWTDDSPEERTVTTETYRY